MLASEAVLCYENQNEIIPNPTTPLTDNELYQLRDLFDGTLSAEDYLLRQLTDEKAVIIKARRAVKALQCDICGHVQRDGHFKRHASSREVRMNLHGERNDAAPINHDDPVAVPRKPFFGTSQNYSNEYVYRSYDTATTSYSLESVRNYLLRLIVKDKVRIPRQWWILATQAVFNYEVTHE